MGGETSKVENTLSLRMIAAMKDSCRSAISSVNQRNKEEGNGAKIREANSDSAVISKPTMTQCKLLTPPRHFQACKEDEFYMQIMSNTELSHVFLVPCGENG